MSAVTLIRSTFERALTEAPDLVERFYAKLFTNHPELKALFGRRSAKAQADMLAQALIAVVEHLEDPKWLVSTLAPMGDKHRTYGVKDEMYGAVAGTLLATLDEACGPAWTPAAQKAWGDALTFVAKTMIAGTAAAGRAA